MNLLLIGNLELKKYFQDSGYNVITSSFEKTSDYPIEKIGFKIARICKDLSIDIVLQVENLSKREIILDLNLVDCLKIFYSIDVHLNFYWHREYAKNFHIFISSQKNFTELYKKEFQKPAFWLPWGIDDSYIKPVFIPFEKRKYNITFIGALDSNRVKRINIINIVKHKYNIFIDGSNISNRLPINKVLDIYQNSRIVINESINNEINFRYFEATFAGALLFTEEINNGENLLFKKNQEYISYNQDNFISKLDYLIKNMRSIEKIAYNGFKKTLTYHTLQQRVKVLNNIILENFNLKYKKTFHSIKLPLFFLILRGIGHKEYLKFTLGSSNKQEAIIEFALKRKDNKYEALNFIINSKLYKNSNIFLANAVVILLEIGEIEKAKLLLKKEDLLNGIIKLIEKLMKEKKDYIPGFINVSDIKVVLTAFDLVLFLFDNFEEEALKNRSLNYLAGKILINNRNYAGAVKYLLNNIRYYPEDILSRKLLAKSYYNIYAYDLYKLETLKIFIIEREFKKFINHSTSSLSQKKEAIMDIISHVNNKKLIRDITFNLENFINWTKKFSPLFGKLIACIE